MPSQGLSIVKAVMGFWFGVQPAREPTTGQAPSAADRECLREERDLLLLRQMPR